MSQLTFIKPCLSSSQDTYKVGENGVEEFGIQGSEDKPASVFKRPDFYSVRSDPGRFSKVKTPDSVGSQSPIKGLISLTSKFSFDILSSHAFYRLLQKKLWLLNRILISVAWVTQLSALLISSST